METAITTVAFHNRPPKFIFIVPYRDRIQHRVFFSTYLPKIMEDVPAEDWTYFFIHQTDVRPFNRGAMKNIGFLAMKYKYPNDYKNIIFIFNDIDTLPYDKNVINYDTTAGTIKHYYGFHFALGGIFSITGGDFEKTNGFPNFWAWGGEDNLIYERAKRVGLHIDRSTFFSIGNMNILQFADGLKRLICRDELATTLQPDNMDGITTIKNLNYNFLVDNAHIIDVTTFETLISPNTLRFEEQTIDKLGKIRVPNKNINSITLRINELARLSNASSSYSHIAAVTPSLVSNIVQPQMPFMNKMFGGHDVGIGINARQIQFSRVTANPVNTNQIATFTRRGQADENIMMRQFGMRTLFRK